MRIFDFYRYGTPRPYAIEAGALNRQPSYFNVESISWFLCCSLLAVLARGSCMSGRPCRSNSAVAIAQRTILRDAVFNHGINKKAVKLILGNGSNGAGLHA